jgi:diguanylate cyclase (GGDEF)-like protein
MSRSITHLAIQLGIKVIAEGVETKEELFACRDIGCHLVQGYLVQKPTVQSAEILKVYPNIKDILESEKRATNSSCKIETYIDRAFPLPLDTSMNLVVEYFQKNPTTQLVTIVNANNEPMGILQENIIKEFIYSPYGRSLMLNNGTKMLKLRNLIQPCGITEINCNMSTIIELFSNNPDSVGIILTKDSKYYGFLSARAIISIMNEQNLIYAREQNPLTKLPGNSMIEKYLSEISASKNNYILCYFDLDNFKAFNDVYGFRNGDRAIILFADILRKNLPKEFFKAHIGGDDFFVGVEFNESNETKYIKKIFNIIEKFRDDARELYSKEDKQSGFIETKNRDGEMKKFDLLSASASLVIMHNARERKNIGNINEILSIQKKVAKQDINHLSMSSLL